MVAGVNAAFTTAIAAKRRDSRTVNKLAAPIDHLREAAALINRARAALAQVAEHRAFDRAEYETAFDEVRRAFDELLLERKQGQ